LNHRVLEVGINDDDGIPARVIHAGGDGELVPEVAGEMQHDHMFGVLRVELIQQVRGAVVATIIHQHELPRFAQTFHYRVDATVKLLDE
jgi:hypothetical protein